MRTKINKINELLAKSSFHTISLQETWFNDEIGDIEPTKNTNYTLFRQDRWETGHHKKGGGGVATLVKSDIKVRRHNFQEIKTIQYICLELAIQTSTVYLLNIYSPFGFSDISNIELDRILKLIEPLYKTNLLIIGDFNMPTVRWMPDSELPGVFLPMGNESDEPFIETLFENDLKQIAEHPVGRNHLDLALVSDDSTTHCTYPVEEEMLDRMSVRHSPFVLNLQIANDINESVTYMNFGRTKLGETKRDLQRCVFLLATDGDALLEQWHENNRATGKIEINIAKLKRIVTKNTPLKKVKKNWLTRHPWLRNSKEYERSLIHKNNSRKNYVSDPTDVNRDIYKRSCVVNSDIYERERSKFLNDVMNETKGNTAEFFTLIKNCNNERNELPDSMLFKGVYLKGDNKLRALASSVGELFHTESSINGRYCRGNER